MALIIKGKVNTRPALCAKAWHVTTICSICNSSEGTANDLFTQCLLITGVWSFIKDRISMIRTPSSIDELWLVREIISDTRIHRLWPSVVLAYCWSIWRSRNELIFKKKEFNSQDIITNIIFLINMWTELAPRKEEENLTKALRLVNFPSYNQVQGMLSLRG